MLRDTFIYKVLRKYYHIAKGDYVKEYKAINRTKFLNTLLKYDIISFDIFDTLITRKIYNPDDLFMLMGDKLKIDDFMSKRKEAEKKANQELKKDVNLDEIYKYYKKLYKTDTDKIQKLEEDLEIELSYPRSDMLDIFNTLLKYNKTVILTSDMYLKKDTITKMITKCGYKGYSAFYLSNDINKRKDTKEVWPYLKNIYKDKKIIHIGDNHNSDYLFPKEFGVDTYKVPNAREILSNWKYKNYLLENYEKNISNSLLLGLLINCKLFNSPFKKIEINSIEEFSYIFYGPILNSFLSFIDSNTSKDSTLLFLAREGYYLEKLYKDYVKINKLKEKDNVYFLASRKASISANMNDLESIYKTLDEEYSGDIKSFFSQRYEVEYKESNFPVLLPDDKGKVIEKIDIYKDEILKVTSSQKDNYLKYIENTIKDYKKKKMTIIDLGYSGTIQYELSKMTNINLKGIYLTNSSKVKRYNKDSKLDFLFDINDNPDYKNVYAYSLILEYFLSAPFGQLQKFNKENGKIVPVYNDDIASEDKMNKLNKMYEEVIKYIEDAKELEKVYDFNPDKDLIFRLYSSIVDSNLINRAVKDEFTIVDYFCKSEPRNVFKIISKY